MDKKNIIELHKEVFKNISKVEVDKAEEYCYKNLVEDLEISLEEDILHLSSFVHSKKYAGNRYDVGLEIDLVTGEILFNDCECEEYFLSYAWNEEFHMCKHMLATFLKYEEMLLNKSKTENNKKSIEICEEDEGKRILKSIKDISAEKKELISLDIFITELKGASTWQVNFKIGGNKKYVLKDLESFINARRYNTSLKYGKEFTFDSSNYYFSHEDEAIINFIEEYLDLKELISGDYDFYRFSRTSFIENKNLFLVESAFKRFLKSIGNKKINYNIRGKSYVLTVKNMDVPLELALTEEEDNLVLKQEREFPIALNLSSEIFIYKEGVYLPSHEQVKFYDIFYKPLLKNGKIVFKKEDADGVFNKILPKINSICESIKLDEKIQNIMEKSELNADFYFDRNNQNIWCKIKLNYGDTSFDYIEGYDGKKYIIRNLQKEKDLEKKLEEFKFFRTKDKFIFTGDNNELFTFLKDGIHKLGNLGQIYCSDKFKEQRIYNSKSISATIGENKGFLDFSFSIGDINVEDFKNMLKAFKDNRRFYKLKQGSFFDFEDSKAKSFLSMVHILSEEKSIKGNSFKLSKNKAIYLSSKIEDTKLDFINGKEIVDDIADKITTVSQINYEVPKDLNATLRKYQITGYNWFKTLSHYGFGGVLADEMGLGKTIQTIAFLLSEKGKKSLIVTPTSLIYNWKNEFEKFAPSIKVLVLHGAKDNRVTMMKNLKDYDVIITTYGTLRNDFEEYKSLEFHYCIIDEAQNIKNPLAKNTEVVKKINANIKFALTGTPIENNLIEIWSIFDYIMPNYLYGKARFQKEFMVSNEGIFKELKTLIKPFILRRLKKDVMKELPNKIEKKFFVEMTEVQKKTYAMFVKDMKEKIDNTDIDKDRITVFSYLTKLRQLCLDPSLLVEDYSGGSAKVDVTLNIIKDGIELGNKILLFSQFTSVLGNLKKELNKNKIEYFYLDGSINAEERLNLVEKFNNNDKVKVFLISLKAGGTGLNLTSANRVIHFDPWWNPAVENQATDRAHRFGQKNMVEVIKLIAQGTIEEKIIHMQEHKKELISKVMDGELQEGNFLKTLSKKEILQLFSYN